MPNLVVVGIADFKIAKSPEILITYALGSCIGTCLYDRITGIAGLSHILLPDSSICSGSTEVMKYADTAIPALVFEMGKMGALRSRLTAKIAGGAQMFATQGVSIGERNIISVKNELAQLGIPILAEDTGKNYGRTVEFHPENGRVLVKSVLHGKSEL